MDLEHFRIFIFDDHIRRTMSFMKMANLCDRADSYQCHWQCQWQLGEPALRGAGGPRINPVKIGEVDVGKTH